MTDPMPEEPEMIDVELEYSAAYDDEADEFIIALGAQGCVAIVKVTEDGFNLLDAVIANLPQACEQLIAQVQHQRAEEAQTGGKHRAEEPVETNPDVPTRVVETTIEESE